MERGIDEPDDHGQPVHRLEQAEEVRALQRPQLLQRAPTPVIESLMIIRCMTVSRSDWKNICSVRHSPMPALLAGTPRASG